MKGRSYFYNPLALLGRGDSFGLLCGGGDTVEMQNVKQALEEYTLALAYFDECETDDLIDYASYWSEAARRKYCYMVKNTQRRTMEAEL